MAGDDESTMRTRDVGAEIHGSLTRVLRGLSRETIRRGRLTSTRRNLSDTDIWLLLFISEHDRARPTDLAAWQDVDKSTITMQVKRLLAGGYVMCVADERDRRATNVRLTPLGREALEEADVQGRGLLAVLTDGWTDEEIEALGSSMRQLAESVEHHLSGAQRHIW